MKTCKQGHTERTVRGDECAVCKRDYMRERYARIRGSVRKRDSERFPCGHERAENTRPGRHDCGACHRAAQRERYRADPVTHRAKARDYQRANRDVANERRRAFMRRNPGYEAARRYAPDPDTQEWLTIIRADPCSYCGCPSDAVDHIKPLARDGANHWMNFAPTCRPCNSSKRDRELLPWLLAFRSTEGAA